MAARTKSQTLSLRLHPHVRDALDDAALIRGQSVTAFVERAIMAAVATITAEEREHYARLYGDGIQKAAGDHGT